MTKRKIISPATIVIVMVLSILAGCIGQSEGRTNLVIVTTEEPLVLETQTPSSNWLPNTLLSQPLYQYSLDGSEFVPDFLESFEHSSDGRTFTWHLREGMKYANGDTLDAQALDDSFWQYYNVGEYGQDDLYFLSETEVIDENTLKVMWTEPPANALYVLTTVYTAPWNQEEIARVGQDVFSNNPVASGPFKFKEWVVGSHVDMVRNEEYKTSIPFVDNKGPVHLEELRVRFIAEDLTRISELEAGNVDIIERVPTADIERVKSNTDIDLYPVPRGTVKLHYNVVRPPFDNVDMRRVMAHALDRNAYSKVLSDAMEPNYAPIYPAAIAYSKTMDDYAKNLYPYDVNAAKAILAEMGYVDEDGDGFVEKDGETLEMILLVATDRPTQKSIGPVVQQQVRAIGIKCEIEQYEYQTVLDQLVEGDYDLAIGSTGWPDPDFLGWQWEPNWPDLDDESSPFMQLYLEGRMKVDLAERTAVYEDAQKILIDELIWIPMFTPLVYWGVRTWVKDFQIHPQRGVLYLQDVTISAEADDAGNELLLADMKLMKHEIE